MSLGGTAVAITRAMYQTLNPSEGCTTRPRRLLPDVQAFRLVVPLLSALAVFAMPTRASAQSEPTASLSPFARPIKPLFGQALDLAGTEAHEGGPNQAPRDAGTAFWAAERRACDGCPRRRVGRSFVNVTVINAAYEVANLARGQVTARITPHTWWANMKQGWVWDLDDFLVNQVGHPYQGSNYFNAARANGLSFWESAGLTAFGSATWEFFGETNRASVNDLINTTLGGIAMGEMFHRTAWLVRDTRATGRRHVLKEIAAMASTP
jgi:hypothetical protein